MRTPGIGIHRMGWIGVALAGWAGLSAAADPGVRFQPLREGADDAARTALRADLTARMKQPAEEVVADPASGFFPGAVRPEAPRETARVTIDPRRQGWQSTGWYAAPGEPITIRLPGGWETQGFEVRIGCHTDTLWHLKEWKRPPQISRAFPLQEVETRAANAFGGLIYIDTRKGTDGAPAEVEIEGAVAAPLYVHGRTSVEEWHASIRHRPAPWAELATDKIVISIPTEHARAIEDPVALMNTWDDVMDACADLAAMPRERKKAERIVPDLQISAGYMHAGYPIMTHADQFGILGRRDKILEGQWGLFHELGHNHQNRDWTFGGSGEVTVNLFTLYVFERVCGRPIMESRPEMRPSRRRRMLEDYVNAGSPFEKWKREPFLALVQYVQMIEAFGWDAFKKCFAVYRELPQAERPRNDDEKRDQWLVRFSRTVGRDLGPFFLAWGVPVSDRARAEAAQFPAWMPVDFPAAPPAVAADAEPAPVS